MLKKIRNNFFTGLLIMAPLFLTVVFIGYLVKLVDVFIVNPLFEILPFDIEATFKIFLTKAAIAAMIILIVGLVGLAAKKFFFKKVLVTGESVLLTIPLFNRVYLAIKEIAQAFFGDKSGVFKRVVFMEYPRKGIYSIGFVTQEKPWSLSEKTGKDLVSVFVPSPPNPATGYAVFVPKEDLIDAGVSVEEGIKMVISGCAAVPSKKPDGKGTRD